MPDRPQPGAIQELDPLIGLTISGRYRVHTLIGQGGMGKVFQAQQIPLGRQVALKVLEASRVDQEFHRRFFQEAAILAKLQSRHTVTIYDYGRDGDIYFIAMELVAGGSLDRVLAAEGPFPARRALSIAMQIGRSLREAHAQGIIHRDLKPGNVVLTRSEEGDELAKVLDFGLAKRVDRGGEETQSDTVPGSPKYMAPEVIRQLPIDGRADLYGLGIMLYQMITGVVPFDAPNPMDILVAHLQQQPRPMRLSNPGIEVPEPLERFVRRCLAKNPNDRHADVQSFMEALRALMRELGLHSDPSYVGTQHSLAPDPAPSGVQRMQSLRIEERDLKAPARSSIRRSALRTARYPILAGALGAVGFLGALAVMQMQGALDRPQTAAPAAVAAPAPAAAAKPVEEEPVDLANPDMVIDPEETLPTLTLSVQSEPVGATVWLAEQRIGVTPLRYAWRSAEAEVGKELTLVLKLPGHANETVRQAITGAQLEIKAKLDPLASDIRALGDRAAAVQRAHARPVLTVKPAEEPVEEPVAEVEEEPAAEEEEVEEAPAEEPVEPNPYAPSE